MVEGFERRLKIGIESEKMFRDKCDEKSYSYMYIDQDIEKFSSKIYEEKSKRPDYILSIPHLGSIFVDVKAYKEQLFFKDSLEKLGIRNPKAFWIKRDEISKYLSLQEETSLKVWFAVIPVKDDILISEMYFIPVDLVAKFIAEIHRKKPDWNYVQVPISCFTDSDKLAYNMCGNCKHHLCEQVEELIQIDEKIHNEKHGIQKQ